MSNYTFLERIFSIKNQYSQNNRIFKVVCVLGVQIKIRSKKLEHIKQQEYKLDTALEFSQKCLEQINFLEEGVDYLKNYPLDWYDERQYVENLKIQFCRANGYSLNLENPKTLSEKLYWLRAYDNTPLKTQLADKYLVREYVKEKIGEEYLIPLLGVYDHFDEIDFDSLPQRFVIKCNHGSSYNIIVGDKSTFNKEEAKIKTTVWLNENFAYRYGEMHYRDIPPKIIIEEYIENIEGAIYDYRYYSFNGKPTNIIVGNIQHNRRAFFDLEWNDLKATYSVCEFEDNVLKPKNLTKMNELASILAQGIKFARIDFYNIGGQIYFGEITFTPRVGNDNFNPPKWNIKLGDLLKLD